MANSGTPSQTLLTTEVPAAQGASGPWELGVRVVSDVAGQITAVRFWKSSGETGAHVGRVWSNAGALLASVAFTNETASGWQQQTLPTPLAIAANTAYVVSVNTGTNGFYGATYGAFTTPLVNAHLTAPAGPNGLYGGPGTFPHRKLSEHQLFPRPRLRRAMMTKFDLMTNARRLVGICTLVAITILTAGVRGQAGEEGVHADLQAMAARMLHMQA